MMSSNNSSTTLRTRQPKQEDALEFLSLIDQIGNTGKLPDSYGNIGRYKQYLDDLIEGLDQDGLEGFNKAKRLILNKEKYLASVYAIHQADQEQAAAEDQDQYFTFLNFKDLRSLPKPKWLLYDVLPTKGISFAYGPRGCGKTYAAIDIACSIATESMQWLDRATKHGHVVYIAAEDIDEVAQRVIAWANHHNIDDIPNLHFFPCPLNLAKETPRFMNSLEHQYGKLDIVLFVVDTLAMCSLGVEENSKKEFDAVIGSLETLWRTYECCVLAIHHSGRNGEIRGTSSIDGVAYSLIQVSEVDDNVMLKSVKKRRGKHFKDIYLDRKTVKVPGEYDEMGNQVETCVLVKSDRTAAAEPTILTKLQQEILEHIHNLGGKDVPRSELMKACMIEQARERSFINAISGLIGKGLLMQTKVKQRTYYSKVEQENKATE